MCGVRFPGRGELPHPHGHLCKLQCLRHPSSYDVERLSVVKLIRIHACVCGSSINKDLGLLRNKTLHAGRHTIPGRSIWHISSANQEESHQGVEL